MIQKIKWWFLNIIFAQQNAWLIEQLKEDIKNAYVDGYKDGVEDGKSNKIEEDMNEYSSDN